MEKNTGKSGKFVKSEKVGTMNILGMKKSIEIQLRI